MNCYYIKRAWLEEENNATYKMYFLDDKPIGISTHNLYITYYWCGLEEVEMVKEYLIELLKRDGSDYLDFIDFEHDNLEEFYKLKGIHEASMSIEHAYYRGEKVLYLYIHPLKEDNVDILITKSGKFHNVPLSDLDFKLHLLDEK